MKKKLLSLSLILCLLLSLSISLSGCAHECEFSTDWSADEASHWHACTGKDCAEIADKAAHTWDEGKITTEATQEADGVKTFTCTVCQKTKTEAVPFTGMTREEWNAAFDASVFENFAYTETSNTKGTGVSVDTETTYKFTKDTAWAKVTMAGQSQESYAPDTASVNQVRQQLVNSIKDLTSYSSYEYDAQTKSYRATKAITIASLNASTSDISLTFSDGKLVKIEYEVEFTQENIPFTATSVVILSDYGTVTLTPPAQ